MTVKPGKTLSRTILSFCYLLTFTLVIHDQAGSQTYRREDPAPAVLRQLLAEKVVVTATESIGMTVSDMDRSVEFYSKVLSFQKISDVEVLGSEYERLQGIFGVRMRVVRMQLGSEAIEFTEYLTPKGRPIPIDSRSNDHWFQHIALAKLAEGIVVSNMERAYQNLRQFKVQYASTAPQHIPKSNPVAAGIEAFYFKDPDGHYLELIYFPPGKGNPMWQRPTKQLFLGIDHTAIAVSNTAASLKFYRDLLGLKLAGESENHGTEQEHLNNVFGARLRISSLKTPAGPAIEFLEYLTPRDGRPYPADARANDLLHWQTTLVVPNAEAAAQRFRAHGAKFISSDIVEMPKKLLGFKKGFLVIDPDGHVMRLVEK